MTHRPLERKKKAAGRTCVRRTAYRQPSQPLVQPSEQCSANHLSAALSTTQNDSHYGAHRQARGWDFRDIPVRAKVHVLTTKL